MKRASCMLTTGLVVILIMGCGDDGADTPADARIPDASVSSDVKTGADVTTGADVATGDGVVAPDSGASAVLTTVMNTITMPKNDKQFAMDLDGNGSADNRLGGILGATGMFFDPQSDLDKRINEGELLMLLELFAASPVDAPQAELRLYRGEDVDGDLGDNFAGQEEFALHADSPTDLALQGAIAGAKLQVGPGEMVIPLPFGETLVMLTLKLSQIHADLSPGVQAMTNGQINGATPMSEIDSKLLPAIAATMTQKLNEPNPPLLVTMMDANGDKTITAQELKSNILVSFLMAPDVDTDGDGKPDSMSMGMGFSAVTCTILSG